MASFTDIGLTILLNALPILILVVPVFFARDKLWNKIYQRFIIALSVYFVVYLVLPSMFQAMTAPGELSSETETGMSQVGASFVAWRGISIVVLFLQYPFYLFPMIFVFSPIVSLFFLWNRLRKEDGSMREKLDELVFEIKESPRQFFRRELLEGNWKEEKELLKLFVVLLPISVYLLSVILDITTKIYGLDVDFLSQNSPLGWFLEIFFVYLAAFLMGIHLLYRSRVSFKGRFLGENLRQKTFDSLMTVGAPISILSIVLFVVNYLESLLVIFYFFAYFLMAAVIFVMFLKIFMPLSIIFLVKLVDWWKNAKKQMQRINWNAGLFSVFTGIIGSFLILGWTFFIGGIFSGISPWTTEAELMDQFNPETAISLEAAVIVEQSIFLDAVNTVGWTLILAGFLYLGNRGKRDVGVSTGLFLVVLYAFTIITLPFGDPYNFPLRITIDQLWVSTSPAWTEALGFRFYTMRSVFFTATFTDPVLQILALPYMVFFDASGVVLWGLLFYYFKKDFRFQSINEEGFVRRIAFSSYAGIPTRPEVKSTPEEFLISANEPSVTTPERSDPADSRVAEQVSAKPMTVKDLAAHYNNDIDETYTMVRKAIQDKKVRVWIPEFAYAFQEAKLNTLHIMYSDGRDVFFYQFPGGVTEADPALVSGMFSAITSFIKETTKSSELLRTIDHGDVKLIIEYGKYVFGAIFADRETTEVRSRLIEFLTEFEEKHEALLHNWTGRTDPFAEDSKLVEDIFEV